MTAPAFATSTLLPATTARHTAAITTSPLTTGAPLRHAAPAPAPARMAHTTPPGGNAFHSRRTFLTTTLLSTAAATLSLATLPSETAAKSTLKGAYADDAATVLADMRASCDLVRGAPEMATTVGRTRAEMNDFVALYRRNASVSGSPSFSTLYTAINTLSGHYASYGNTYPVPEKRKKRLVQQFAEIDRALKRGR